MAGDDELVSALPHPPQPAPARREAAIEEAMRRFDGLPSAPAALAEHRSSWWLRLNRSQAGALASAAVVALIALPLAWSAMSDQSIVPHETAPAVPASTSNQYEPSFAASHAEAPPALDAQRASPSELAARNAQPAQDAVAESEPDEVASPPEPAAMAPPPPPPPPAAAPSPAPPPPPASARLEQSAESAPPREKRMADAARSRADQPAVNAAGEEGDVASAGVADKDSADVVVTGSRMERAKPQLRGDWNACTIDDPGRNLRVCRRQVDGPAPGANGRAAAHIADGLASGWKGDLGGALADFERAVAAAPRSSLAYLNRGLARKRAGDLNGALADLDQAVRFGPSARTYYQRSLILRQRGDRKRAGADERRALALDPSYRDLIK